MVHQNRIWWLYRKSSCRFHHKVPPPLFCFLRQKLPLHDISPPNTLTTLVKKNYTILEIKLDKDYNNSFDEGMWIRTTTSWYEYTVIYIWFNYKLQYNATSLSPLTQSFWSTSMLGQHAQQQPFQVAKINAISWMAVSQFLCVCSLSVTYVFEGCNSKCYYMTNVKDDGCFETHYVINVFNLVLGKKTW